MTTRERLEERRAIDDRRRLTAQPCTLDGKPAAIVGSRNRFATVVQIPDGAQAVYAWPTVARVLEAGGAFRS